MPRLAGFRYDAGDCLSFATAGRSSWLCGLMGGTVFGGLHAVIKSPLTEGEVSRRACVPSSGGKGGGGGGQQEALVEKLAHQL